ncbi:hypothetical protein FACS1894188_11430 [Clostridia bacterium]|nr:hypothetical protein FACS1894188_11430 [Clostridia bacterium]
MPELPTVDTFERYAKKIPVPYVYWFRNGEKAYIGKCEPYIKRMYEDLSPNDMWVADNHTFDIMLYDGEKPVRMSLTTFMDVRTRKIVGWCVTDNPCADATLYALKKGIKAFGIPYTFYTDNGREFLARDVGGNGGFRRKKKPKEGEIKPPTILEDLGIEFVTAIPKNARAKGIERTYKTLKEQFGL